MFSLRADGFSWADCAVVFEQLGRACVPGPLVSSVLAGTGEIVGVVEAASPVWVEHLDALDALVVLDGDTARRVAPSDLAADPSPWPLDPLTPVARVARLPAGTDVDIDVEEWRRAGAVLTAAFQLGLADRMTEVGSRLRAASACSSTARSDRSRRSSTSLADMLTRTEVARAAVYAAGAHLDAPAVAGLDRSVAAAKIVAGEAAVANGKAATQVHGGMGYTWEVDVHLFLKRAWLAETQFGSADAHADRLAATLAAG